MKHAFVAGILSLSMVLALAGCKPSPEPSSQAERSLETTTSAQTTAKASSGEVAELLEVIRWKQNLQESGKSNFMLFGITPAQLEGSEPVEDDQKELVAMIQGVQKKLTGPEMKSQLVRIYSEAFTPAEVSALTTFFKSSAGQAFLDQQPGIISRTAAASQKRSMALMPQMMALMMQSSQPGVTATSPPKASQDNAVNLRPDIEELLTSMKWKKTIEQGLDAANEMMSGEEFGVELSPEEAKESQAARERIQTFLRKAMTGPEMKSDLGRIYSAAFTAEQTPDLIAFFKTPEGEAYIDQQSFITKESMKVSEALFEPLLEDLFESEEAEGAVGALFEGMAESALSSEGGMSAKNTCIMHLKHIDGAKQQWAIDNRKNAVDMPTKSDLYGRSKYIKAEPKCPEGGAYTIRNIGEDPTCSLGASHGHSL